MVDWKNLDTKIGENKLAGFGETFWQERETLALGECRHVLQLSYDYVISHL